MSVEDRIQHFWVGPCGCYSDIAKPSRNPWFWKPQVDSDDFRSLFLGNDYWGRSRLEILRDLISPVFVGGDEYCRLTLVLGMPITGRMIIPLWGHSEKSCGDCPMMDPNTKGTFLDTYLTMSKEIAEERTALKKRAKNIKKLSSFHK